METGLKLMRTKDLRAETIGSVGLDLRVDQHITFLPGEIKLVFTTLEGPLSENHDLVGFVCARSSIAKLGLVNINSPGVIDADYTGKIGVVFKNMTDSTIEIKPDERVAQILLMNINNFYIPNTSNKQRTGGFGSTGKE